MSQSLSKVYIHLIFHIKSSPHIPIRKEDRERIYAYMATIIKDSDSRPILINGTDDHVHIFCVLSKNIAISKLVQNIKGNTSRWMKTLSEDYIAFSWQTGYGVFSVSPSAYDKTLRYIQNQEEHHKKRNTREEYILFLKEYGIEYDEMYVLED